MARRRISESTIARAIEMRERGLSLGAIARIVGCSPKALSWHFLKLAVDPPKPPPVRPDYYLQCPMLKRGDHFVRAFTPAEDVRLLELETQGHTIGAIAKALGRRWSSTRGRLMTLARHAERAIADGSSLRA